MDTGCSSLDAGSKVNANPSDDRPESSASANQSKKPTRRTAVATGLGAVAGAVASAGSVSGGQRARLNLASFIVNSQSSEDTNLKRRARADYQRSMERFGGSLSSPIERLFHTSTLPAEQQFDVLVIGSG